MKTFIFLSSGLAALILAVWLYRDNQTKRTPETVSHSTLESIFSVHGSPNQALKICGREFRQIRGGPPYYAVVSNTSLFLFVQERSPGIKTLIVCNTNDCTFKEIPLDGIRFGDRIGYWNSTGGKMGDTVEMVESNRIFLLSKSFSYVEKSVLDLKDDSIRVLDLQSEYNTIDLGTRTNN